MRLHAQDPTAYCTQFFAENHTSQWDELTLENNPASDMVLNAEMTASAASPDESVLMHESSPPSFCDPMLNVTSSFAAIASTQDSIFDDQAPPTQLSVQESPAITNAFSQNGSDVSSLAPAAVERVCASMPRTLGLELEPSLSPCPSPAPSSPRPLVASSCRSTIVPMSPSPIAPETAAKSSSVAPSPAALEIHDTEMLNEEAKAETPVQAEEPALKEKIKRKEPDSEAKLPSPKRQRTETPVRVAPKDKRMSASARDMAASRVKSMKKLATPFRSPLVAQSRNAGVASPSPQTPSASTFKKPAAVTVSRLVKETTDTAVTSPFRPPMPKAPATSQPSVLTVQTLERRLQLLKRAIKIKDEGGDAELEKLALKWKNAARAASWDLWELVKNGAGTAADQPTQGGWNDNNNWGWGDDDKKQQFGSDGTWDDRRTSDSTGEHNPDVDMDSESDAHALEKADPSVGTMLAELGIAPSVLGWKEDEGDFSET